MKSPQTKNGLLRQSVTALAILILARFIQAAQAEVPVDPPDNYSATWLGNTYMDKNRYKEVTEELNDICASPNGHVFSAGYAETWGRGAEYRADDGGLIARYDRFESGFGDPVNAVAPDAQHVFWALRARGF